MIDLDKVRAALAAPEEDADFIVTRSWLEQALFELEKFRRAQGGPRLTYCPPQR